jgi:hypothetical protein
VSIVIKFCASVQRVLASFSPWISRLINVLINSVNLLNHIAGLWSIGILTG